MNVPRPHFVLTSESSDSSPSADSLVGHWRFRLQSTECNVDLQVEDDEPHIDTSRLELLALVRGLEALDQPSRVTLVTSSSYVRRGLKFGLDTWREDEWKWERFGEMTHVKDSDLWQRVDRALRYHRVECRTWRFDNAHGSKPDQIIRFPSRESTGEDDDLVAAEHHSENLARVERPGTAGRSWRRLRRCVSRGAGVATRLFF